MATRASVVRRRIPSSNGGRDAVVTWTGLLNGDRGAYFSEPGMVLRSWSVSGTLGAGGTVQLRASCADATDPAFVEGAQADETLITGASVAAIGTVTNGQYTAAPSYAPVVTAGDGTTSLTFKAYFIAD